MPEGLAKSDWQSIREAYEAGRHAFQPVDGGWQARNPGQQWTTTFDQRGFLATPGEGDWTWGLELQSYGFGERQQKLSGTPTMRADGQRLSYQWDASVEEWFINDQRGLEHGFTVKQRPAPPSDTAGDTLDFVISVRGALQPVITADALGVMFRDKQGATVLNYSGLKVWDADGRVLSSRFEASGAKALRLRVEEQGARYPLTVDPIAQQAYLTASNNGSASDDMFGYSVCVAGNTVVVGAPNESSSTTGVNSTSNEGAPRSGAAYVFVRSGTTWTQQAYLKASQTYSNQFFGQSVSISADSVVVGASATAYVFLRSGTNWVQQANLQGSYAAGFGNSVSISGDTVVVGSYAEDSSSTGINSTPNQSAESAGAAYVFVRSGTTWTQQAYLKASNTGAYDYFGRSVAVTGDTVVVGAYGEDSGSTGINSTPNSLLKYAGSQRSG